MGIDPEQLEREADADYARLTGQAPPAEKQPEAPNPAEQAPPPPIVDPEPSNEAPAPDVNDDWQDKFTKAEESRKNAHALMTQATQKAADLERSNQEMQQQMAQLQVQMNQLAQQPQQQANPSQQDADQFKELREDYEELNPVFNKLDEGAKRNQALEQRLAAIEQQRNQQEQSTAENQFWNEVRKTHPDIDQVSNSQDFQGWFARQTPDVQAMSRISPVGAAHVMTLYKQSGTHRESGTQSSPNRMQQAQQLSEPQVRGRSQPTTKGAQPQLTPNQIAALPQKEYEANEAAYDKMIEQWVKQGGSF